MLDNALPLRPITAKMELISSVLWVTRGNRVTTRKQRMVLVSSVLRVNIALTLDRTAVQMAMFALSRLKMVNRIQLLRVP